MLNNKREAHSDELRSRKLLFKRILRQIQPVSGQLNENKLEFENSRDLLTLLLIN